MALSSPLIFGWLLSVWSCNGNDGTIKGEYFVTFFGWNMQNLVNSPCLWPQITFTASYLQWRWRERETGVGRVKNDPAFPPGASEFGDLRTPRIGVKMGVFFRKEMVAGRSEGRGTLPWLCQGAAHHANRPNHCVWLVPFNERCLTMVVTVFWGCLILTFQHNVGA